MSGSDALADQALARIRRRLRRQGYDGILTPQEVEMLIDLITTGPLSDEALVEALILGQGLRGAALRPPPLTVCLVATIGPRTSRPTAASAWLRPHRQAHSTPAPEQKSHRPPSMGSGVQGPKGRPSRCMGPPAPPGEGIRRRQTELLREAMSTCMSQRHSGAT
jgi:hypothetical protein